VIKDLGDLMVSLKELATSPKGRLILDVVGKHPANGRVAIYSMINNETNSDVDDRLILSATKKDNNNKVIKLKRSILVE
jgi:hypothetical protein